MAKLPRILAHTTGGSLDNRYFSVHEDQQTIEGFDDMPEGSAYVKESSTLRALNDTELGLSRLLFDPDAHDLSQICDFVYQEVYTAPAE